MRKIPTLYIRDVNNPATVTTQPSPECAWVFQNEGTPFIKRDGTSCMLRFERTPEDLVDVGAERSRVVLYRRRELKQGKATTKAFRARVTRERRKGFIAEGETEHKGKVKVQGWVPCDREKPSDQWHFEAFDSKHAEDWREGTYELIGPKIQGNAERQMRHVLVKHDTEEASFHPPRTWAGIRDWFTHHHVEGLVFHHPDGRMGKIKRSDFGLPWPSTPAAGVPL